MYLCMFGLLKSFAPLNMFYPKIFTLLWIKYFVALSDKCPRSGRVLLSFSQERGSTANINTSPDHPFFVFGQGWSSCDPHQSRDR